MRCICKWVALVTGFVVLAGQTPAVGQEAPNTKEAWKEASRILARINAPRFPRAGFSITDYGARGDGETDCSEALHKAIDACAQAGGGRVLVPRGEFLTGAVRLLSGVNLHLERGAVLKFKTTPQAYLPAVATRFEGMECYNYSPLIYAYAQTNIAVTGPGLLDGQAGDDNWWQWKGKKQVAPGSPNQTPARARLARMAAENVPVDQRRFGRGDYLRPSFVEFNRCRDILIEDVRIRRSPMWELHPLLCTNVTIRGVNIMSHGPNNDGCDPESSRDVLIERCVFDTGDDCIAIKSGRNNDGRRVGVPSEDLVIRRCTMKDGHGGVVIGSEVSGGCSNVFVEHCQMDSTNLERVLRIKSNAVRGGVVENVFVRDSKVGRVSSAALQIDFLYEEGTNGSYPPAVKNIVMERVTVTHSPRVLDIACFPGAEIRNVRLDRCRFEDVAGPDTIRGEADVKLVDCRVSQHKETKKTGTPEPKRYSKLSATAQ